MKITPVKGTNDYLPEQTELRQYMQNTISRVYTNCGFARIATPILEDIENLDKSDGGDNLNLIFKIMKRGEKLAKAVDSGKVEALSDMGLRYDLTLPLSRYYANHHDRLPNPFKVIQMGRVYRAERPQRGRLREFMQCDIDILGSESQNCEIELIHTTAKALLALGIDHFKVKINDRRILTAILLETGFLPGELDSVCVTFDKLAKIGADGVREELTKKDFDPEVIARFMELLSHAPFTLSYAAQLVKENPYIERLASIIETSEKLAKGKYTIEFDMTLVRGQGYYTGTVFEIESLDFNSSIAGGGRYDNLIGKFLKQSVPAVGFSIGFERIFSILSERQTGVSGKKLKVALIYREEEITQALTEAENLRKQYDTALVIRPKKLGKYLNKLEQQGFDGFLIFGQDEEVRLFEDRKDC